MAKFHILQSNGYPIYVFQCPGCGFAHFVKTEGEGPKWTWNQDMDCPTVSPSLLVRISDHEICHSFIKNGKIEFLSDCTHNLAGKTVDIPDWED